MGQPIKTFEEVQDIIKDITFKDRKFTLLRKGDGYLLQMSYTEIDVETGEIGLQKTRKWYISSYATTSEIVQTALKCVLTSQEHIGREWFMYKGERVFGPHFNVDDLVDLARTGRLRRQHRIPLT